MTVSVRVRVLAKWSPLLPQSPNPPIRSDHSGAAPRTLVSAHRNPLSEHACNQTRPHASISKVRCLPSDAPDHRPITSACSRRCPTGVYTSQPPFQNLLKCNWSPTGELVSTGSADNPTHAYVFEFATGKVKFALPGHKATVNEVCYCAVWRNSSKGTLGFGFAPPFSVSHSFREPFSPSHLSGDMLSGDGGGFSTL